MKRAQDLETLTETAVQIGQERVCAELGLFAAWLDGADEDEILPCPVIGPITTARLVREVWLNPRSNSEQLAAAGRELRARYLADNRAEVLSEARRAMEV